MIMNEICKICGNKINGYAYNNANKFVRTYTKFCVKPANSKNQKVLKKQLQPLNKHKLYRLPHRRNSKTKNVSNSATFSVH